MSDDLSRLQTQAPDIAEEYVHPITAAVRQKLASLPKENLSIDELDKLADIETKLRERDRLDKQQALELEEKRIEAEHGRALDLLQERNKYRLELVKTLTRPVCAVGLWTTGVILFLHGEGAFGATVFGAGTAVMIGAKKKGKEDAT